MGKTYILGADCSKQWIIDSGIPFVSFPNSGDEVSLNDFIVDIFSKKDVDKLVIDLNDNPNLGLDIAMHFRLSCRQIHESCLAHILFVSGTPLTSYLNLVNTGQLFLTEGISICSPKEFPFHITVGEKLSPSKYFSGFLNRISVNPKPNIGRHSLANQWGAYALGCHITDKVLPADTGVEAASKSLYFKYVDLKSANPASLFGRKDAEKTTSFASNVSDKKILLIDDEAKNGWEFVLKEYFKDAKQFDTISEKVDGYDSLTKASKDKIVSCDYDIVFLDLRLNGIDEDENNDALDFSGMKVLSKIKSINPGIQVIIFTASNKAWNLKTLLDNGADGYFIKESPEYHTEEFSVKNFKSFVKTVDRCINRCYLKAEYEKTCQLKAFHYSPEISANDWSEIKNLLDFGYRTLSKANTNEDFAFAYVTIYPIIEKLAARYIDQYKMTFKDDGSSVLYYEYTNGITRWLDPTIGNRKVSVPRQIVAIYNDYKDEPFTNRSFDVLNDINDKRNSFIHKLAPKLPPDKRIAKDPYSPSGYIELLDIIEKLIVDLAS